MNEMENIQEFIDDWKKEHGSTKGLLGHNIYLIKTVDRDGNVTSKGYALNAITHNLFKTYFSSTHPCSSRFSNLFIGDGASAERIPGPDDYSMFSAFGGAGINNGNGYNDIIRDYDHIVRWDPDNQVLTMTGRLFSKYWDYTVNIGTGVTERAVTEIGIANDDPWGGTDGAGNLGLHAAVYDEHGEIGNIYKRMNERLYVTVYYTASVKLDYLHDKIASLRSRGIYACMALEPWLMFKTSNELNSGGGLYGGNKDNFAEYFHGMICYPRSDKNIMNYSNGDSILDTYTELSTANNGITYTIDDTNHIINHHVMPVNRYGSVLIEDKNRYWDMYYIKYGLEGYNSSGAKISYGNPFMLTFPVKLPTPEEFNDILIYSNNMTDDSITNNFGYRTDTSNLSPVGRLPVTDFQVTSIKSYNGITHDWDIMETVQHAVNNYLLTSHYLYPWVMLPMDLTSYGMGKPWVVIWFNNFVDRPIEKFGTNVTMYASDSWWDPSTWVLVENMTTSVPQSVATKSYYITLGGSRSIHVTTSTTVNDYYSLEVYLPVNAPIDLTRTETKPTITYSQNAVLQHMDQATYSGLPSKSYINPIAGGVPFRHNISCESMGYIWMSNSIYYPNVNKSYTIETQDCLSNIQQMAPSIRFTEPTGHRILQIFRADTIDTNVYNWNPFCPRLSKISVFDIPDENNCDDGNGNWTGTEYLIDMNAIEAGVFVDNFNFTSACNVDITSTENGHVVFCQRTAKRAYIVNLLGDATHNYEPFVYVLTHPTTGLPLETSRCWAVKYTNYIVTEDTSYTSDIDYQYMIIDLSDNSIYQIFKLPKGNGSIAWIRGWKDYLYIVFYNSNSNMWLGFYDMTLQPANRFIELSASLSVAQAFMPGGGYYTYGSGNRVSWYRMMGSMTFGDEHSLVTYVGAAGQSTTYAENTQPIYLVDDGNASEIINISYDSYRYTKNWTKSLRVMNVGQNDEQYTGTDIQIGNFNNGKQKLLIINSNGGNYYTNNDKPFSVYHDLNYIRDKKSVVGFRNDMVYRDQVYPFIPNNDCENAGKWCSFMFDGKLYMAEYDTSHWSTGTEANINVTDPNKVIPHMLSGTTTTIQCYNDPKRIHNLASFDMSFINDANVWNPNDLPPGE